MRKRRRTRKKSVGSVVPSTRLGGRLPNSPASRTTPCSTQSKIEPPQFAEKLLLFVLPKNEADEKIGDLAEYYTKIVYPKLGARCARVWYYKEVWILARWRLPMTIKRIPYTWIVEFIRRHVS
jgi:hypothetical protein